LDRRDFLFSSIVLLAFERFARAALTAGQRLAAAARAQVGVTTGYDPTWTAIPYPNGDVPRSTGVCADVIIRAARDGLGIDLQRLVHEDMVKHFDAYPARAAWHQSRPDASVDHRRVLNLETYFERAGAQIWKATVAVPGDAFPKPLEAGDILTWVLNSGQPHMGIAVSVLGSRGSGSVIPLARQVSIVHNIGRGAEESLLAAFWPHRAAGHYRWPAASVSPTRSPAT